MRLYLSSYKLGNQPQRMVEMAGSNKKAAVILNAVDFAEPENRRQYLDRQIADLNNLGFNTEELDLRNYFGKQTELKEIISKYGLVWVTGGNCFVLRRAFAYSGFDEIIKNMLERDAIMYAGFSAGIDMLVPDLRGVELVDPPDITPEGYKPELIWECLNILPYAVAPHYKSNHPESVAIDKSVQYYIDNHILFKALRDGEAIVINGNKEEIIS